MYRYTHRSDESLNRGGAASPLNLKSVQVYILEKTASLPVTDNRSLEKACKITAKNSYGMPPRDRK